MQKKTLLTPHGRERLEEEKRFLYCELQDTIERLETLDLDPLERRILMNRGKKARARTQQINDLLEKAELPQSVGGARPAFS